MYYSTRSTNACSGWFLQVLRAVVFWQMSSGKTRQSLLDPHVLAELPKLALSPRSRAAEGRIPTPKDDKQKILWFPAPDGINVGTVTGSGLEAAWILSMCITPLPLGNNQTARYKVFCFLAEAIRFLCILLGENSNNRRAGASLSDSELLSVMFPRLRTKVARRSAHRHLRSSFDGLWLESSKNKKSHVDVTVTIAFL